jgi:predicted acylesterase/phospholipase RssA
VLASAAGSATLTDRPIRHLNGPSLGGCVSATTDRPLAAADADPDAAGGRRTAFVLGGGGNLGSVQVGMLSALFERDIRPDLVVG